MKGETTWDGWRIPETEIYETVQVLRRKLVLWLRVAPQAQLDSVMDGVLRASATNDADDGCRQLAVACHAVYGKAVQAQVPALVGDEM